MINFTVGPVISSKDILEIGGEQVPYFRTNEFSKIMLENENMLLRAFKAPNNARVIFMTGSGTASMDAAVLNLFNEKDKLLVINGGSFGHRFCEICDTYDLNYTEVKCEPGKNITREQLYNYDNHNYTALLVNLDETSTGVLYDIELISEFCKKNNMFLLVDSISSFLCDEFNMGVLGVNAVITGSQKALALAPGISVIVVDEKAIDRINNNSPKTYYFNLKSYLINGLRGQTPFTPAVGILLQLHKRLSLIEENGGVESEITLTKHRADFFRSLIKDLPFKMFTDTPSNAVTSLVPVDSNKSAYKLFEILKDKYNIWICPNGGEFKEKIFRVGHIGNLTDNDYITLVDAIKDVIEKKLW